VFIYLWPSLYRYNIVTEIMQATTNHNWKKSVGADPDREVFSFGTGKGDILQVTIKQV
jgi:hypothetical protein